MHYPTKRVLAATVVILLSIVTVVGECCLAVADDLSYYVFRVKTPDGNGKPLKDVGYASLIDKRGIFITARHVVDEAGSDIRLVSKSGKEVMPAVIYAPKDNSRSGMSDWALLLASRTGVAAGLRVDADQGSDPALLQQAQGIRNGYDKTSAVLSAQTLDKTESRAESASKESDRIAALGECPERAHAAILVDYTYGDSGSALIAQNGSVVGIATEFRYADSAIAEASAKAFLPLLRAEQAKKPGNGDLSDSVQNLEKWLAKAEKDRTQRDALSDVLAKSGAIIVIPISCMLREFSVEAVFHDAGGIDKLRQSDVVQGISELDELNDTVSKAMQGADFVDILQFFKVAVPKFKDHFWSRREERDLFSLIVTESARSAGIWKIMNAITDEVLADTIVNKPTAKNDPEIPINIITGIDSAEFGKFLLRPSSPDNSSEKLPGWWPSQDALAIKTSLDHGRYFAARAKAAGSANPILANAANKLAIVNYAFATSAKDFSSFDARGQVYAEALNVVQSLPDRDSELASSVETRLALLSTLNDPDNLFAWTTAAKTFADRKDWVNAWWVTSAGAASNCPERKCSEKGEGLRIALKQLCREYFNQLVSTKGLSQVGQKEASTLNGKSGEIVNGDAFAQLTSDLGIANAARVYLPGDGCAPVPVYGGNEIAASKIEPGLTQAFLGSTEQNEVKDFSKTWTGIQTFAEGQHDAVGFGEIGWAVPPSLYDAGP
ncbi:serine protease [Mesorhizobium sp. WSM4904]|uniref:S1 family peptidase n=1 Tax=Mesorhizobium sp. WSM4904 TaxID=3038545 RepID=UPI002418409F|nr:serine protease [Mesorhizobium sp. WSM4904]WFP61580.1 trypsin-like serine protease [Mesorhizobium sp. WSM4904]